MKKILNSKIKLLALVVSIVMLFTCFSVCMSPLSVSAAASDIILGTDVSGLAEVDNGCYKFSLNAYKSAYYTVDLTKGFYFYADLAAGNYITFNIFKNTEDTTGYTDTFRTTHNAVSGNLFCYINGNGIETKPGTAAVSTHFVQAVAVTADDGTVTYRICVDGTAIYRAADGKGFIMSEADFKNYNNYNSETGIFEGCYLKITPNATTLIRLSFPTDDRYTGSIDNNFPYTLDVNGYDDIALGVGGRANATQKWSLLDGITFTLGGLEKNYADDFVTMGFGSDLWAMRYANYDPALNMDPSFRFRNVDGKLAVSVFDGTAYGDYVTLDTHAVGKHNLRVVEETVDEVTSYKLYIDGCEVSGLSLTEYEVYFGLCANNGAEIFDIRKTVPTDKPFIISGGSYSASADNGYTLALNSYGTARSTKAVDLLNGISFKINSIINWTGIHFYSNYWNTSVTYSETTPRILLRNVDGKIQVSVMKVVGGGEYHKITTTLSASESHIIYAKPVTTDGVTTYEFYIDDVLIDGGDTGYGAFSMNEENFKILNGYNTVTDSFEGAYFYVTSNGASNTDIADVKLGDANGDDVVNDSDLTVLRKYLLGISLEDNGFYVNLADANDDGVINILDLVYINELIA